MKKIINFLMVLILMAGLSIPAIAKEEIKAIQEIKEVVPIENVLKQSNPSEPSIGTIASSLFTVILLVLFFGFIYSKMSKVNLQKLFKGEIKEIEKNSISVLSTTSLGTGKSMHMIEVNNKQYLIGATASNISLISEIKEEG